MLLVTGAITSWTERTYTRPMFSPFMGPKPGDLNFIKVTHTRKITHKLYIPIVIAFIAWPKCIHTIINSGVQVSNNGCYLI